MNVTIGGSEAAAALGLSPWCSPLQLYARKIGAVKDDADNDHTRFGKRFEELVLEESCDRHGLLLYPWPKEGLVCEDSLGMLYAHPERPWQTSHPDGIVVHPERKGPGVSEVKCTDRKIDEEEGPPLEWQIQLQHNIDVMGVEWGTLNIMRGRKVLAPVFYDRDPNFLAVMREGEQLFIDSVERRIPPKAGHMDSRVLGALYGSPTGESVDLDSEAEEIDQELLAAKAEAKLNNERVDELQNRLKEMIGDALVGVLPSGATYTWALQNRKGYTVEPTSFRVLRRAARRAK